MTSPARRHWLRTTAALQAQADPLLAQAAQHDAKQMMLAKLYADRRTLKDIQSQELKTERKRQMLPDYMPYIDGALQGSGTQDDVLMTIMVWFIDVGDYANALRIARYALAHQLAMPDRFARNTATVLAEEIADAQLNAVTTGQRPDGELLVKVAAMVDDQDMPDQVRAKLYKAMGLFFEPLDPDSALEVFTRAFELNPKIGVKQNITQLTRRLKKEQAAN